MAWCAHSFPHSDADGLLVPDASLSLCQVRSWQRNMRSTMRGSSWVPARQAQAVGTARGGARGEVGERRRKRNLPKFQLPNPNSDNARSMMLCSK